MHKTMVALGGAALALILAGCGSTVSKANAAAKSSSQPTSSQSSGHASQGSAIKTGHVMVSGKSTTVLENSRGYTLYYFTKDTPTHSACEANATCAKLWHPAKASQSPSVSTVSGKFSLLHGQVEYQGHPLYTYTGDTGPGQSHGEGLFKEWYVATPSLAKASSSGSSSGGYGSSGGSSGSSSSGGSGW